jgi:hypothetical protein
MHRLLFALLALTVAQAQEVVRNESGPRWVRRADLVPRSEFNLKTAMELTNRFLQSQPQDSFVQFSVVTEVWQVKQPPRLIDPPFVFSHWIGLRRELMQPDWTMTETTALGGSAVMRFRMGREKPERHVLKGTDPLLLEIDGAQYEIVHVWLSGGAACVFIRTAGALQSSIAERVVKQIGAFLPVRPDMVYFRHDAWFPTHFEFPYYCPLCGDEAMPTEEELNSSPETSCMVSDGKISCRSINVK